MTDDQRKTFEEWWRLNSWRFSSGFIDPNPHHEILGATEQAFDLGLRTALNWKPYPEFKPGFSRLPFIITWKDADGRSRVDAAMYSCALDEWTGYNKAISSRRVTAYLESLEPYQKEK